MVVIIGFKATAILSRVVVVVIIVKQVIVIVMIILTVPPQLYINKIRPLEKCMKCVVT